MLITRRLALPACALICSSAAYAATINENFESATAPSIPAGWTFVNAGSGTYATGVGTGNPGQSGNLDWTGANQVAPGAYIVNAGSAIDATQAFSVTFDFYIVEDGNYSAINFLVGDVQDGITGSAGEFLNFQLNEKTFGTRARLYNGANGIVLNGDGNNNYEIFTNQWNTGTFTWTPTSGTTGDLTFSWIRPTNVTEPGFTVSGFTFDSADVYFGFGTGRSPARFDNIQITGSEVIPEPSSLALIGLGGLLMVSRRRRD